jgi:hypothetical protein
VKTVLLVFSIVLFASTFTLGYCGVDTVIVRGRVDHPPKNATVRVELVYAPNVVEDSGEVDVENGTFSIPIDFLTRGRRKRLLIAQCDRKPMTVIVTLVGSGRYREYDRISLDFGKDFKTEGSGGYYTLRSELVLGGSR